MNDFVTVFIVPKDIEVSLLVSMIVSLLLIAICVAEVILRKKGRKGIFPWPELTMPPTFGIVVGSIILIGASTIFIHSIIQSNRLVSEYERGEYEVVEGIINVLHMQPAHGNGRGDIVRIGNVEFEIIYRSKPGYTLTIANGGVLRDGIYARVYYKEDNIMRIDIHKTPVKSRVR